VGILPTTHELAPLSISSGGSDTARIIRHGLRHWDGLTRFLDDGRIELDTNIVERSMRPQALTRKNAFFKTSVGKEEMDPDLWQSHREIYAI
jgi:Transposase IS66 family